MIPLGICRRGLPLSNVAGEQIPPELPPAPAREPRESARPADRAPASTSPLFKTISWSSTTLPSFSLSSCWWRRWDTKAGGTGKQFRTRRRRSRPQQRRRAWAARKPSKSGIDAQPNGCVSTKETGKADEAEAEWGVTCALLVSDVFRRSGTSTRDPREGTTDSAPGPFFPPGVGLIAARNSLLLFVDESEGRTEDCVEGTAGAFAKWCLSCSFGSDSSFVARPSSRDRRAAARAEARKLVEVPPATSAFSFSTFGSPTHARRPGNAGADETGSES